jgi:hypothetical protein
MRKTNVVLRILYFGISGALACAAGPVPAQGPAACDTCKDLCRLMDWYQQRVKAIEIWRKYAGDGGKNIPSSVKNTYDMENLFKQEFGQWLDSRRPGPNASSDDMGSLPCKLKPGGKAGAKSNVEVSPADCKIYVKTEDSNGNVIKTEELAGPARDAYESAVDCKVLSDAEIAHEETHKMHCENAYREFMDAEHDDAKARARTEAVLDTPRVTAESELDAYIVHRDMIHDAILSIVRNKGCGWDPTTRQKQDPDSIPSLKQVQDMSRRAWQAASALSDGGVSPPDVGVSGGVSP